jgi:hypothetical protein
MLDGYETPNMEKQTMTKYTNKLYKHCGYRMRNCLFFGGDGLWSKNQGN